MADFLTLEQSVPVVFRAGSGMAAKPRYRPAALDVTMGERRHIGHEAAGVVDGHLFDSLLLMDEYMDEFTFCGECYKLVRMVLGIPENLAWGIEIDMDRIDRWLTERPVSGAIYLAEPLDTYFVRSAVMRWCGDREMIAFHSRSERPDAERLRVDAGPGLHLLFADGVLVGWVLQDPERCITDLTGQLSTSPPDLPLARILRDYLNLMAVPGLTDFLVDKNPEFRRSLESVVESIRLDKGAIDRRTVLRRSIIDLIVEHFDR